MSVDMRTVFESVKDSLEKHCQWNQHWLWFGLVFALINVFLAAPVHAQAVPYTEADLNSPPTAGSFTYNGSASPPTYTSQGSGGGFTGGSDTMAFVGTPAAGNVEYTAEFQSQSSTNSAAYAGIAIRDSYNTSATMAAIGVVKGSGLVFTYRPSSYSGVTQVAGPTVSGPIYLRLARTPGTISGEYSTDGQSWTTLGTFTRTTGPVMPALFYVGLETYSGDSTLNTSVFSYLTYATSVPQVASNLLLWLRPDQGLTVSSGKISAWADSAGTGLSATQTNTSLQPTFSAGQLNNSVLGAVTFNGTNQYLSLGSGLSNLTAGATIVTVLRPATTTATSVPFTIGNASNSDALFPKITSQNISLNAYNSTTASSVSSTSNPISASAYQLVEEVYTPGTTNGTGTITINGTQQATSSSMVATLNNITRSSNVIGAGIGPTNFFGGNIAEILIYSAPLTVSQLHSIEAYAVSKYGVGVKPTLDPPVLGYQGPAVLSVPVAVTPTQDQGATIYFNSNGEPLGANATSNWYNGVSIPIAANSTLQTIAVAPFFNNSAVASATFVIDKDTLAVPRNNLVLWLSPGKFQALNGANVQSWGDSSGSGNTASQATAALQPPLIQNALNGYPSVNFTGTQDLQIPAGLSSFSGVSVFALIAPTSATSGSRLFDFGNGATSNNIYVSQPSVAGSALYTYNGSSATNVTSTTGLTASQYKLLEIVDNGTGTATLYVNGAQLAQSTSMNSLNNITRTLNFIGASATGSNKFNGQIVELMVYSAPVSTVDRANLEGYFAGRYQTLSLNTVPAPKFSTATSTLTAPVQVAIEAPYPAVIYATIDGTTPLPGTTPVYTKALNIFYTQTVKAIAVMNGVKSAVSTATYTLDATRYPAP